MDPGLLRAASSLADRERRDDHARALARELGATDLVAFVTDEALGGRLVLAPGFRAAGGGRSWRALLDACRSPGLHRARVDDPRPGGPAVAFATPRSAFVLIGELPDARVRALAEAWPLVEAVLVAEHRASCAEGALDVARAEAQRASALASALDRARSDLATSLRELEQQARALQEARASAESATRAKDAFLAMLGHEMRNPLAPIVTALHLLRMKGQTSREIETIDRQVQHLSRLVDDLLDVGRVVSGKLELRAETTRVADVVERAVEMVSPALEKKKQRLTVSDEAPGALVVGDPARLAQVLSNLLTNASRYSPDDRRIVVRVARAGPGSVALEVEDEGIGMAADVRARAFDAFFQAPQQIDRARGGLGLGLAIAQAIVRLHGGEISAHSEGPGRGSTFTVRLPIATGADLARGEPAREPGVRELPRGLTVLIVDDNEEITTTLAAALDALGCRTATALDGPTALIEAERARPAVALVDLGLPVMDGFELAQRLRERPWARDLVLVAISGYAREADQQRTRDAGFDAHLAKPVTIQRIAAVLAELLSERVPRSG